MVQSNPHSHVLVSDSDATARGNTIRMLEDKGLSTLPASSVADACEQLNTGSFDAVIVAVSSDSEDIYDLLRSASAQSPPVPVIVLANPDSVQEAAELVKAGAVDYVVKPVLKRDIHTSIELALQRRNLLSLAVLAGEPEEATGFGGLLGASDAMGEVHNQIRRVAPYRSTVLITGESGTGKELAARAIHALSPVSAGRFLAINCSALPGDLVESELFGHEKGAYTGAGSARAGLFEAADGGTVFLDEIAELPLESQSKLLRVIEDHQVLRLGSTRPIPVDIRLLAATNLDLEQAVRDRRFREDLYYRLNVLAIDLPPLRVRREDVPLLTRIFLDRFSEENGAQKKDLSRETEQCLQEYPWPGNVRELLNLAERLSVFVSDVTIKPEHLPPHVRNHVASAGLGPAAYPALDILDAMTLEQIERLVIDRALGQNRGNRTRAAARLGISVRTLQRKLKEYGADPQ